MRINSCDIIEGQPIVKVRELMRHLKGRDLTKSVILDMIVKYTDCEPFEARSFFDYLVDNEYFEKDVYKEVEYWHTSIQANALALASLARPIKRNTAVKKLKEFITRVEEVNNSSYYLYKVEKVVIFGSYLSESDQLGDIDLAVQLAAKESNGEIHVKKMRRRAEEAHENGRQFNNFVEELYWGETEVKLYLKSHSRYISLHDINDRILEIAKYQVIFES